MVEVIMHLVLPGKLDNLVASRANQQCILREIYVRIPNEPLHHPVGRVKDRLCIIIDGRSLVLAVLRFLGIVLSN